jgi:hypothetical protein
LILEGEEWSGLGHVVRMAEARVAKTIFENNPETN